VELFPKQCPSPFWNNGSMGIVFGETILVNTWKHVRVRVQAGKMADTLSGSGLQSTCLKGF
jgi:hypothetical protein